MSTLEPVQGWWPPLPPRSGGPARLGVCSRPMWGRFHRFSSVGRMAALGLCLGCGADDRGGGSATEGATDTAGSASATGATGATGAATQTTGATGGSSPTDSASTGSTGSDSTGGTAGGVDDCDCAGSACPPRCITPLVPEIGYLPIEPVTYTFTGASPELTMEASAARLWFGFVPADKTPEDKPVLVLFNGGPGAASEVLFGFNTVHQSFDEENNGGGAIGPAPSPWTAFANVLYVDARVTGFSYNLMDDPTDGAARQAEFTVRNFNVYLDAADFVRAIVRFLADHPVIRGNEVVLVGESYGGVRATAILDLLLDYAGHGDGAPLYQDDTLVDEIQTHLDIVFPDMAGQTFGPADVARQFRAQVLVQPLLLGTRQLTVTGTMHDAPGSVIFQIAQDTGTTFVPCSQQGGGCNPFSNALNFVELTAGRDRFAYPFAYNWLFDKIDSLAPKFSTLALATEFFEADPTAVEWLYAQERTQAYRAPGLAPYVPPAGVELTFAPQRPELRGPHWALNGPPGPQEVDGDYPATFGGLPVYDTYYMSDNYVVLDMFYSDIAAAYEVHPYVDNLSVSFLRNLAYVETFITNAAYDLVIWSPSLPPTLEQFTTHVTSATHDPGGPAGADRPGQVVVNYADGAFGLGTGESRTIRMPPYASSHTVTLNQPAEIAADLAEWLGP